MTDLIPEPEHSRQMEKLNLTNRTKLSTSMLAIHEENIRIRRQQEEDIRKEKDKDKEERNARGKNCQSNANSETIANSISSFKSFSDQNSGTSQQDHPEQDTYHVQTEDMDADYTVQEDDTGDQRTSPENSEAENPDSEKSSSHSTDKAQLRRRPTTPPRSQRKLPGRESSAPTDARLAYEQEEASTSGAETSTQRENRMKRATQADRQKDQSPTDDPTTAQGVTLVENPHAPAEMPRSEATLTDNPQAPYAYKGRDNDRDSNTRQEWEEARPCTGHSVRSLQDPRFLSDKIRYGKNGKARKTLTNEEAEAKGRPEARKRSRKRGRTRYRNLNDAGVGGKEHRNATESENWIKHRDSGSSSGCRSSSSDNSAEDYIEINESNYNQYGKKAGKFKGRAQLIAYRSTRRHTEDTDNSVDHSTGRRSDYASSESSEIPVRAEPNNEFSHSDTERQLPAKAKFYYRTQTESEVEDASDGGEKTTHRSNPKVILRPRCKLTPYGGRAAPKPRAKKSGEYLKMLDDQDRPTDSNRHQETQRKRKP